MNVRIEVSNDKPSLLKHLQLVLSRELHLGNDGCLRDDVERAFTKVVSRKIFPHYRYTFAKVRRKRHYYVCALAHVDDKPVAALYLEGIHIQFFTKPEYRNKGLQHKLLEATKEVHDISVKVLNYFDESPAHLDAVMSHLGVPTSYEQMRKVACRASREVLQFRREQGILL